MGVVMKSKLSKLKAPAIAGVVKEKSVFGAIAEIKNCAFSGADMIDLHMSTLEKRDVDSLREIISSSRLPVLALNYNTTYERGDAGFSEDERAELFLRAVEAGADGVDIQGYTFHLPSKDAFCGEDRYSFTKGNPHEVVTDGNIITKQCELIEKVHSMGAEVLLSCHPRIAMAADAVVELALFLEKRNPDIIKIVTKANNEDELYESIRAMMLLKKEVKTPVTYHASGAMGGLSRIINPLLGGQIAFCIDRFNGASTMEQLDLKTVRCVVDGVRKLI